MTGRSFLIFIHPDDVQKTVELSQNKVHNCRLSNYENRYIRKDGFGGAGSLVGKVG
jgi:hypothetical protein